MRVVLWALALAAGLGVAADPARSSPYGEDEDSHVTGPVRDLFRAGGDNAAERAMQADLSYAESMARHHQGAVDMAEYYLADPRGTNPILRRLAGAIIRNQAFEIGLLDVVRRDVARGPQPVPGVPGMVSLARGWQGLEHERFFVKAPPPSMVDLWLSPNLRATEFDVQFARPMIEHHAAAIDMALAYNRNPDGGSSVLGPLNYDIMTDQRAEIDLLRRVIARYPSDPAAVADDAKMMEIMDRSMPGMGGHGGHGAQGGHGGHGTQGH